MTDLPARGEVWWCEMAEIGRRPVVVLSRDVVIPRHRRALVAPCTTIIRHLPSEVLLEPGEDPVPLRSAVNLDSVSRFRSQSWSNASAGWPMTGCGRSAPLWPSQSTAQTERSRATVANRPAMATTGTRPQA